MNFTIRRLNPGEADLYRVVRLESLRESPEAFATTYEAASNRTHESWVSQCEASAAGRDRATFIVLADQPVGLAALYRNGERPSEGELLQVWVSPAYRGGTVATELIDAVFHWAAANGFGMVRAEVTPDNVRALRFYEKCGFVRIEQDNGSAESNCILTRNVRQNA
ncbi:MAG: GNAT family N-acetyltransferase [Verrucomicrobiota bacterium]